MKHCGSCGSPVPGGQKYYSMCVGDISYGHDGYYEQWLLERKRKRQEQEELEQLWLEEHKQEARCEKGD